MQATITDDDAGKDVVDARGEKIGIVSSVEHGTAYVDPDPGITDEIAAKLDWGGRDEEDYPLQEALIAEITDDEVRVQDL
ncbi:PRC-barrel domain containing protein [Halobaculum rarum]|uniref:PRC-barrel domain containing protein n=1 Tax=Halobaculum rarum TaxID=3075122 RepID=UPI0032B0169C